MDIISEQLNLINNGDTWPFGNWKKAAGLLKEAGEKGEDISPAIDGLKKVFLESRHVPLMETACDTVVIHFLNIKNYDKILELLKDKKFSQHIAGAFSRCADMGRIDEENLFLLTESLLNRDVSQYRIYSGLKAYIDNREDRLIKVLELFDGNNALRKFIPVFLREASAWDRNLDKDVMEAGIPFLVSLFNNEDYKKDALSTLQWLVELDIDITGAIPFLENDLDYGGKKSISIPAYCIAYNGLIKENPDFATVDSLLSHRNRKVRNGTISALGIFLKSHEKHTGEIIPRVAQKLTDRCKTIKETASGILTQAFRDRMDLEPGSEVLKSLLKRYSEKNPYLKEYLLYYVENDVKTAKKILRIINSLKIKDKDKFQELTEQCRKIIEGTNIPICRLCKFIPGEANYTHKLDVPKEIFKLKPEDPIEKGGIRKCPECGNYYLIKYEEIVEFIPPDISISIRRLSKGEALEILKDKEIGE